MTSSPSELIFLETFFLTFLISDFEIIISDFEIMFSYLEIIISCLEILVWNKTDSSFLPFMILAV